jgi:stage II sporulation SpoE-like protein
LTQLRVVYNHCAKIDRSIFADIELTISRYTNMNNDDEAKPGPVQAAELSPAERLELKDLSRLNSAMFSWVCSDNLAMTSFLAAMFDKTDPSIDKCEATRSWDMTLQGDFYLLQRLGRFIYVVAGDAAGHHAYAGALKVFVAAALKQVFEDSSWYRALTAESVLHELQDRFFDVGKVALKDDGIPLSGGANVVVVRIDIENRAITYASAGLPVFTISSRWRIEQHGKYSEGKGVSFPQSLEAPSDFKPEAGSVPTERIDYLAFVTDGFRNLKRLGCCGTEVADPFFTDEDVKAALLGAVTKLANGQSRPTPQQVAGSLITAARRFREGYMIPEIRDDDRLVVVMDVQQAAAEPPVQTRAAWWRNMANFFSSLENSNR